MLAGCGCRVWRTGQAPALGRFSGLCAPELSRQFKYVDSDAPVQMRQLECDKSDATTQMLRHRRDNSDATLQTLGLRRDVLI